MGSEILDNQNVQTSETPGNGQLEKALKLNVGMVSKPKLVGFPEVNDIDHAGKRAPFVISTGVLHNVVVVWTSYVPFQHTILKWYIVY